MSECTFRTNLDLIMLCGKACHVSDPPDASLGHVMTTKHTLTFDPAREIALHGSRELEHHAPRVQGNAPVIVLARVRIFCWRKGGGGARRGSVYSQFGRVCVVSIWKWNSLCFLTSMNSRSSGSSGHRPWHNHTYNGYLYVCTSITPYFLQEGIFERSRSLT